MPKRPGRKPRPAHARDTLARHAAEALAAGRFDEAEAIASRALAARPGAPALLATRAAANLRLRRLDQAEADIEAANRAVRHPPPEWSVTLALVHRQRGRLDRAETVLREALATHPADQALTGALAEILATRRRHHDAHDLLAPLVARGADRPALLAQFGRVCRFLGRPDEALPALRAGAERTDHPAAARQQVLFELGATLDALGRHDAAFEAFRKANALEARRFDIEAQSEAIDRILAEWTPKALARAARRPPDRAVGAGVVLIVGMRRSGTTLTERILAAHPSGVAAGGELPFLRRAAAEHLEPEAAARLGLVTDLARCTPERLAAFGDHYLRELESVRPDPDTPVTDKMPANAKLLGPASLALPGVRAVWCRRDPLDTCLSCFMQPFNDNSYCADLPTLARYHHDIERLMRHWQASLETPILELSYEDLVASPEEQTRRLLEFCGLSFDPACLEFHRHAPAARTASTDQVARRIHTGSVRRAEHYRTHLGPLIRELERLGVPLRA